MAAIVWIISMSYMLGVMSTILFWGDPKELFPPFVRRLYPYHIFGGPLTGTVAWLWPWYALLSIGLLAVKGAIKLLDAVVWFLGLFLKAPLYIRKRILNRVATKSDFPEAKVRKGR